MRRPRLLGLCLGLVVTGPVPLHGQDLEATDVQVTLDAALPLAQAAATKAFPDLPGYLLYSIGPRVLKGDPGGLHWEVRWQERAFPHRRWLVVRVYMKDGHAIATRLLDVESPRSDSTAPK